MNILLTGASTGIGLAATRLLAAQGHRVFATARKPADLAALAAIPNVEPLALDVADAASRDAALAELNRRLGDAPLHGLVNNAGIGLGGPVEYVSLDDWRRQLEVNLIAPIALTQACLDLLRRGPGRIVNISSIGGRLGSPMMGPYNASKFGLEAVTEVLRAELEPWNIAVISVAPGAVKTPIWDKATAEIDSATARLGPTGVARYAPLIQTVTRRFSEAAQRGVSPDVVGEAIVRSLTAPRPPLRIWVGTDAKVGAFMRWLLPERWFFAMLART